MQSVKKAKRPSVITALEAKIEIVRNVEADVRYHKEVLAET
jgi:hypothetical protein